MKLHFYFYTRRGIEVPIPTKVFSVNKYIFLLMLSLMVQTI